MRILILMIVALLVACGDGNGQEARQSDAGSAVAAAAADKPKESLAAGTSPCEMLTEAMIREYLQPDDIEITGEEGDTNLSVYCQHSWFIEPTEEERQ
jgi:hypothetical protein